MRRRRVHSTSIASIGYQPVRRELEIEFRESGDVYRYFDVPGEEHTAFMAAESKGTYLNQVFKPRGHRFVVVFEGKKPRS
jgi:KTSC domain